MVQKSCCKLFCCTLPNLLLQPNSETPQWLDSCKLAALLSWELTGSSRLCSKSRCHQLQALLLRSLMQALQHCWLSCTVEISAMYMQLVLVE